MWQPNSPKPCFSARIAGTTTVFNGTRPGSIAGGVIESGNWRNPEHMAKALPPRLCSARCPGKDGKASIATDAVITSDLMLPKVVVCSSAMRGSSQLVVRWLSPWPPAATVADWWRYDSERVPGFAMCRSEVIENARRCLLDIGLQLQHVEPEQACHWRPMQRLQRQQMLEQSVAMLVIVHTDH